MTQAKNETKSATVISGVFGYARVVVTRIYKHRPRRLFIAEWQKYLRLTPTVMAGRMGIERESYYRLLREPRRIDVEKLAALADAMGIEPPDFYRPPQQPSADAILSSAPAETRETAIDILHRLVGKKTGT